MLTMDRKEMRKLLFVALKRDLEGSKHLYMENISLIMLFYTDNVLLKKEYIPKEIVLENRI